jgi:hypothetical protein
MNSAEQLAYQTELRRVVRRLRLPMRGNLEEAIVNHCIQAMDEWVAALGRPDTLTELLELVGTSLGIAFEEISGPEDIGNLLKRFPPSRNPVMAQVPDELDDRTDAVMVRRDVREAWERPFLALINCQGWHFFRRFFTKWHEVVHRMLEGQQLKFAFRHTLIPELRRDPEEVLVDKVTAALAFYPPIFLPVFSNLLDAAGHLSFAVVDETRSQVAPDASRHATLLACLHHCPQPVWFVRCSMGYRRQESRQLAQSQLPGLERAPEPKLRVKEASGSQAALDLSVRVHSNMRVPVSSAVAQAFSDPWGMTQSGSEPLEAWQTSSGGPIGYGTLEIEAVRINEQEVWALLRPAPNVGLDRSRGGHAKSSAP